MPVAECVRGPWVLGVSPRQARSPRGVVGEGRQLRTGLDGTLGHQGKKERFEIQDGDESNCLL